MREAIAKMVIEAIKTQGQYLDEAIDFSDGDATELYSDGGQIDSLSLVTIIADIEQRISTVFDIQVSLATYEDLSTENSPFSTLGSMLGFVTKRVQAIKNGVVTSATTL